MRTWKRIAIRLYAVVLASVAMGVASRTVTYHDADTGDLGVYYAPVGVEYAATGPLWSRVDVWACGEGTLPSWRCPAESRPVIATGRPGTVPYVRTDEWAPLTAALSRQVRRVTALDPAGCLYRWPAEDSLAVRCVGDGVMIDVTWAESAD